MIKVINDVAKFCSFVGQKCYSSATQRVSKAVNGQLDGSRTHSLFIGNGMGYMKYPFQEQSVLFTEAQQNIDNV